VRYLLRHGHGAIHCASACAVCHVHAMTAVVANAPSVGPHAARISEQQQLLDTPTTSKPAVRDQRDNLLFNQVYSSVVKRATHEMSLPCNVHRRRCTENAGTLNSGPCDFRGETLKLNECTLHVSPELVSSELSDPPWETPRLKRTTLRSYVRSCVSLQ
jgi:hypothetical protein